MAWREKGRQINLIADSTEQKLGIAVAAGYRGRNHPRDGPTARSNRSGNVSAYPRMDRPVADHPLLQVRAASLELRLDQGDKPRRPARQRQRGGQNQLERDETHIDS